LSGAGALLLQAYETLCPGKATAAAAAPPAGDSSDISALLASEVADLKDASKQTFYWHSTGVNSVAYVELKDPGGRAGGWVGGWVCGRTSKPGLLRIPWPYRLGAIAREPEVCQATKPRASGT
jgi:hypothetical protein